MVRLVLRIWTDKSLSNFFFFVLPFQENGLAVFCEKGTWSRSDYEHRTIIGGKWGAIDKNGKIIIPAIYESGRDRHLKKNNQWYKLNNQQKLELDPKF